MKTLSKMDKSMLATCPACGLLCDDIVVEVNNDAVTAVQNACKKGVVFFEHTQPQTDFQPTIAGKAAPLVEAINKVASLLKNANAPVIDGLSTDLLGFRATFKASQKANAALKHTNAASISRNMRVLQSTGWQTTTLTEVKNRADLILCIGGDLTAYNPRFYERFVDIDGMFVEAKDRRVIVLGEAKNQGHIKSTALEAAQILACKPTDLPSVVATLRAIVSDKPVKASEVAGIKTAVLKQLAEQLKAAKYAVIAWVSKDFDYPHAELTIQQITETVVTLNQHSRAAGLPLGGSDGDTSANYANTWLSGATLNDEVAPHDLMIWVNDLNVQLPANAQAQVVIASQKPKNTEPDVFIPVATPGLNSHGMLFRVDGSVTLPLKKLCNSPLPTLSEVMGQIEALL